MLRVGTFIPLLLALLTLGTATKVNMKDTTTQNLEDTAPVRACCCADNLNLVHFHPTTGGCSSNRSYTGGVVLCNSAPSLRGARIQAGSWHCLLCCMHGVCCPLYLCQVGLGGHTAQVCM